MLTKHNQDHYRPHCPCMHMVKRKVHADGYFRTQEEGEYFQSLHRHVSIFPDI